jgi:hypothetical protein
LVEASQRTSRLFEPSFVVSAAKFAFGLSTLNIYLVLPAIWGTSTTTTCASAGVEAARRHAAREAREASDERMSGSPERVYWRNREHSGGP